jgi:hypothetical protein
VSNAASSSCSTLVFLPTRGSDGPKKRYCFSQLYAAAASVSEAMAVLLFGFESSALCHFSLAWQVDVKVCRCRLKVPAPQITVTVADAAGNSPGL